MHKKLSQLLKAASVELNFGKLKQKEENIYEISEQGMVVIIMVKEEKPELRLVKPV